MDNTRHERAITVAASYVIGFVSAFIAFGVNDLAPQNNVAITMATPTPAEENVAASVAAPALLSIEEEGLVLTLNDEKRLLTARKASPLLASVVSAAPQPGMAIRLTEAELSRDGKFVYFCEQLTEDAETCDPYIYSVAADVLHPVVVADEAYTPDNASHRSAWAADGRLELNGFQSISADTPWKLQ